MAKLTFAEVDALLKYEPETGKLFWKERPREMSVSDKVHSMWTSKYSGKEAFTSTDERGYKQGRISGGKYYAHRVIWMILHRHWPEDQVDHINGVRSDNKIGNLRQASASINGMNKRMRSDNKSGVIGVFFEKRIGKWVAYAQSHKSNRYRKYFDSFEEAVEARKLASLEMGFHPNHGR